MLRCFDPEDSQDDTISPRRAASVDRVAGENRELVPRAARGEGDTLVVVVLVRIFVGSWLDMILSDDAGNTRSGTGA